MTALFFITMLTIFGGSAELIYYKTNKTIDTIHEKQENELWPYDRIYG